jgi:glycosyltransferase involved in cell wall biosynthesis
MSDACRETFARVNMPAPEQLKMATIYPFVPRNLHTNPEQIREKSSHETLEYLFCVQGRRFLTKGGLDVLEAHRNLMAKGYNIHLRVITKLSELDKKTLEQLTSCEGVSVHDFTFSYAELEEIYAKTNILIHPSSDDSFGLTLLEAMKGGCAVITTDLYAFPEMVQDDVNGILLEPKYRMFTEENIPNPKCWKRWKKLYYTKKKDPAFVSRIEKAVEALYLDREKLCAYSLRSLELADTKFGEDTICQQWKDVWNTLSGGQK